MFDPNGKVSIYEFLSSYEKWAHGYLSDSARARLLFTKYLPPTLTEGYDELKLKQDNYGSMKDWLIDHFGSVKGVADMQLKAIKALKTPKSSDTAVNQSQYYRNVHRLQTTLFDLEIRKGVKVPQLQEHIAGHTFLTQLGEVLPFKVREEWTIALAKEGVILHRVEGTTHFHKVLKILKEKYLSYELMSGLSPNDSVPVTKTKTHLAEASCDNASDSESDSALPKKERAKKKMHAATSSPGKPKRTDQKKGQTTQPKASPKPQTKLPRWSCPMKGHEAHSIKGCNKFFEATPKQRRSHCRWEACWVCLSRDGKCKTGECSRIKEMPTLLICQD